MEILISSRTSRKIRFSCQSVDDVRRETPQLCPPRPAPRSPIRKFTLISDLSDSSFDFCPEENRAAVLLQACISPSGGRKGETGVVFDGIQSPAPREAPYITRELPSGRGPALRMPLRFCACQARDEEGTLAGRPRARGSAEPNGLGTVCVFSGTLELGGRCPWNFS